MNKKLLVSVLAAGLLMTSCGASAEPIPFTTGQSVHLAGPHEVLVDGKWKVNEWAAHDYNEISAASLKDIQKLDKDLYEVIKTKDIKALYTGTLRVGTAEAGWLTKVLVNGEVKEIDGGYCVKSIVATYESTDEVYNADYWVPSPESGKAESLTPDTFFVSPNRTDTADENGFDHNTNTAIISGAGEYTYVFVQYASVAESGAVIGVGAVKTA